MKFKNWIEKTYCLYASEWHLAIMLLPFISNKLCEKDKIYMKFENSIEDKFKQLTSKLKMKNKNEINDIKWNMEMSDDDYSPNEKIYIVAGSNEYIEDMNNKINQYYVGKDSNVRIVNCFDISVIEENTNFSISIEYNKVLTTKGESFISAQ